MRILLDRNGLMTFIATDAHTQGRDMWVDEDNRGGHTSITYSENGTKEFSPEAVRVIIETLTGVLNEAKS